MWNAFHRILGAKNDKKIQEVQEESAKIQQLETWPCALPTCRRRGAVTMRGT